MYLKHCKIFIFIFIISISNVFSFNTIDSLENLIKQADDLEKINIYEEIFKYYYKNEPSKSLIYAQKKLELSKKLYNIEGEIISLINIGAYYWHFLDYDNVLNYNLQALELSRINKFYKGIILSNNNIGAVYAELSNTDKAFEYYWQNYDYIIENKLDTVAEYYNYYAICLNNIGEIYSEKHEIENSIKFFQKSLEIHRKTGDNALLVPALINLAVSYLEIEDYENSEKRLFEAIEICKNNDLTASLGGAYLNLGILYINSEEYEKASEYLKLGSEIANNQNLDKLISFSYYYYSEYYEKIGLLDSALYAFKQFKFINDSIFREDLNYQVANLEVKFETEKKNQEIEYQHKLIARKNLLIFLLIGVSLIISLLLYIVNRQYKDKKIAYDKIVLQNLKKMEYQKDNPEKEEILTIENQMQEQEQETQSLDIWYLNFVKEFETKKMYLDAALTIESLAKQFDTNRTYLSQLINSNAKLNFNGFINKYRIEYALEMLSNPKNHNLSIEGIANSSGFKSKSTFNNAFKNLIGITPSYFRDSVRAKQNMLNPEPEKIAV